jgi:hypothetical protein
MTAATTRSNSEMNWKLMLHRLPGRQPCTPQLLRNETTLNSNSKIYHLIFMTHHHFKAPWGRTLLIISIFTTLLTLGLAITLSGGLRMPAFVSLPAAREVAIPLVLLIPLGALPFVIRGYVITKDGILIKRLWWNTVLPFDEIRSAEVEPLALSSSFRTCGNGGLYSFTGYYWNRQLGHFHAYVTDLNRTVIVRMKSRTAVLSPDDPEGFARAVNSALHA